MQAYERYLGKLYDTFFDACIYDSPDKALDRMHNGLVNAQHACDMALQRVAAATLKTLKQAKEGKSSKGR
jgi:hypothetical protein